MKEAIVPENGARPVGPYSPGVRANGWVFVSGQVPMDPETGEILRGDIESQTHRVMKNLAAVLEAAGSSLARVVKTTVYLRDLSHFEAMNRVYGSYFDDTPPARSTIQAAQLPKQVDIEIDVIALA